MNISGELFQKAFFRARDLAQGKVFSSVRKGYWSLQGAAFGKGTVLFKVWMTWPHQVQIGRDCLVEPGVFFKYDGIWSQGPSIVIGDRCFIGVACEFNIRKGIVIGDEAAIASGCKFIDHDHGIAGTALDDTPGKEAPIQIERLAWLGANTIVLKGVVIGERAVIGAGSVVTKNVPEGEIWAGVPARKIGERNEPRMK